MQSRLTGSELGGPHTIKPAPGAPGAQQRSARAWQATVAQGCGGPQCGRRLRLVKARRRTMGGSIGLADLSRSRVPGLDYRRGHLLDGGAIGHGHAVVLLGARAIAAAVQTLVITRQSHLPCETAADTASGRYHDVAVTSQLRRSYGGGMAEAWRRHGGGMAQIRRSFGAGISQLRRSYVAVRGAGSRAARWPGAPRRRTEGRPQRFTAPWATLPCGGRLRPRAP